MNTAITTKNNLTTIVAQATPVGSGGIGVIRISGPKTKAIMRQILQNESSPRKAQVTNFYNNDKQIIDNGLALFFPTPNSFTGEDVLELQSHGSQIILDQLLRRALELGAELARPGEFSERAFLNNKIDLTQAEAICDLINASSEQAAALALKSLQGEFAKHINKLFDELTNLRMQVEAAIDFSEEEIDFIQQPQIAEKIKHLLETITTIYRNAQQGVLMQEGISVVIAGHPNVGKSSLLNWFCGYDCAIVTSIPGTTRDVLREYINLDGLPLHIIDTAGLRDSTDEIEKEGIKRAYQEIEKADFILLMTDHDEINLDEYKKFLDKIIVVRNKIDLIKDASKNSSHRHSRESGNPHNTSRTIDPRFRGDDKDASAKITNKNGTDIIYVSVKTGEGLSLLRDHLKSKVGYNNTNEGQFMARRRHLEALLQVKKFLLQAQQHSSNSELLALFAEDLRQAQNSLGEITGKFYTDDLLDKIFSTFCVGK